MGVRGLFTNRLTVRLARKWRNVFIGPGWNAFHRDNIYRQVMMEVLDVLPVSSWVETGTWMGDSTQAIALHRPNLPIFTCEVVPETFEQAKSSLAKYPNITQLLGTSDESVGKLVNENKIGALPFFYLDAHWQTYWPLRAELKHISNAKLKAVIVIDDFEVPGRSEFGFDIDGGGNITEGLKCNLDYIRPSFREGNSYRLLYPKYSVQDGYGDSRRVELRGHIVIFQNLDAEFAAFQQRPFVKKYYEAHAF